MAQKGHTFLVFALERYLDRCGRPVILAMLFGSVMRVF